jgi:hypothetical protein
LTVTVACIAGFDVLPRRLSVPMFVNPPAVTVVLAARE